MKISDEILNLSFGFRGVMKIRESIHSIVLQHAILESGMAVGIVNPHETIDIDEIEPQLLKACEDLVFNRSEDATECMLFLTNREKDLTEHCKMGWCRSCSD